MICPRCSREVEGSPDYCPACGAVLTGRQVPDATDQQASGVTGGYSPVAKQKPSRAPIIAMAVLGVVVIVGLVVGLVALLGPKPEGLESARKAPSSTVPMASSSSSELNGAAGELEQTAETESDDEGEAERSSSSSSGVGNRSSNPGLRNSGSSGGSASKGLSDIDAYWRLVDFYADAAEYDDRIAACSKDFNASCLVESKQTRSSKAAAVRTLKQQIDSSWNAVRALDMPFWSINLEAWEDLCDCYECLWNRIDVIDRAWNVSLSYDKPKQHEGEVLGVIRAEMDSDGNNKYYNRFNRIFPTITLVKPTSAR